MAGGHRKSVGYRPGNISQTAPKRVIVGADAQREAFHMTERFRPSISPRSRKCRLGDPSSGGRLMDGQDLIGIGDASPSSNW